MVNSDGVNQWKEGYESKTYLYHFYGNIIESKTIGYWCLGDAVFQRINGNLYWKDGILNLN